MRKRILSVILAASMLLALTPNTVMAATMDGESLQIPETSNSSSDMEGRGTESSPYRIKNAEQLLSFADMVNGVNSAPNTGLCAVLTCSIDLSGICSADIGSWSPIGTNANPYTGIFDGGSFAITGLYYHKSNSSYAGLFGYNAGIIKNLGVAGADVAAGSYTGGLCGYNNGTITGCYNAASVSGSKYTGGVCGYNDVGGTVSICYNTGAVNGSKYVGGICGYNKNTASDCYNMGAVNGASTSIGGICGYNRALLSNCFNTGTVNGGGKKYIGSVCGYNHSESSFLNCYYLITGEEKGNYGVGMTQEQFASGEVCWLLNDGKSENVVWRQTCSAGFPAFSGKVVYQVQQRKTGGKSDEMIVAYTNEKEKKQASNNTSTENNDSDNTSTETTDGHVYQEPEWKWKEYKSAKAVFTCQDCGEKLSLEASISKKTTKATCGKKGETVYIASVDRNGESYTDKKIEKLEKPPHQPLVQKTAAPATCTEPGIIDGCWTCPACGKYFADQDGKTELSRNKVVIPAKGHQYGEPNWIWTPNYSASATFTCKNCPHTEEKKGTVTSKTNATCEKPGDTVYTAIVKFNNTTYKIEKTVNGEPIPHSYGTPKWSWAADYTTATATLACKKCSNSVTKEATLTPEKITDSTCKAAGKIKHTAIVELDGEKYSDVKNESLPLGNHNFGEPVWAWAKDNKSATATFTCGTCKKRVPEEAKVTKDVPDDLTCGAVGEVKYTASVTFENKPYSVDKTAQIQLEHKLNPVAEKPPTCTDDGHKKHWKCSVCQSLFNDSAGKTLITEEKIRISATGHTLKPVTKEKYTCTVCGGTFTVTVSSDGTTSISSVDADAVVMQDETEKVDGADCSDEEKQDEAEPVDEKSPSPPDSEETQENSEPQDIEEQDPQDEQDEESMQNEDESNNGDIPDVLENAARYGLIYPDVEGTEAIPVTANAGEENAVNLRAASIRNDATQTVREQQQQGYPLWVSATVLALLAGVVLFFILRKKGNQ